MNKIKRLLALIAAAPLILGGCVRNNGYCYCDEKVVKDENEDGLCDICGLPIVGFCAHADLDGDGYCDICGHEINPSGGGDEGGGEEGGGDTPGGGGDTPGGGGDTPGGGGDEGGGGDTPVEPPVDPNVEVTTYLVLSSVGRYDGDVGQTIGAMHLENAIAYVALPGSPLPGADKVTHSYGSCDFSRWLCYEGLGAPTVYTTVPYAHDKILYAEFVPNGQEEQNPDPIVDPDIPVAETQTYYLVTNFPDGSGDWDIYGEQDMWVHVWNTTDNRDYKMSWDHDRTWKVDIPKNTYTMILFLRVKPYATSVIWDGDSKNVLNQTIDTSFVAGKTVAQITSWGAGYGAACPVSWIS